MHRCHFEQQSGRPQNRGEQVVEVVGDAAGQPSHRLHFLGLTILDFELPHLGEIGGDQHHARHLPRRIMDRCGGAIHGHRSPVFLARGGFYPAQRLPPKHAIAQAMLVLRVLGDHGEGATHDVIRTPPVQCFGRRIPAAHISPGIDRVDRQRRAVDHRLELRVCLSQRTLGLQAAGHGWAEHQPGDGENTHVEQQGHIRARNTVHHERTAAAHGVADQSSATVNVVAKRRVDQIAVLHQ